MSGSGGTIRQRKDGRWEGRYWSHGRRRSVFATTRREAQTKLRAGLLAADQGIRPIPSRITVADYLDEWLDTSVRPRLRPRTAESYAETVRRYVAPAVGKVPLAKLEPVHVARMLARLTARGDLSSTTVRYAYVVLRIGLGRALKTGRVMRNVATLIDPPGKARTELHPLSAEQVRTFLAAVSNTALGPLYVTAIATGMRQGECLALRWSDLDLDGGTLAVRHSLSVRTRALVEPKTERARRTIRLPSQATAALREHRRRQLAARISAGRRWIDGDFVFTSRHGEPLASRSVTRSLQAALARASLPRQRFHDLRHCYATLMLEAGEELAVVSKSLGHANLSTTADVYAHLTPAMQERSAARMDAILGPRQEAIGGQP